MKNMSPLLKLRPSGGGASLESKTASFPNAETVPPPAAVSPDDKIVPIGLAALIAFCASCVNPGWFCSGMLFPAAKI
jgi:hypothetical protein